MADDDEIDCDNALVVLYQFLDGELTVERRTSIEFHLDGCPHCFSAFDFEEELRIVVRTRLQRQVPSGLVQRIARAIDSDAVPPMSGRDRDQQV